MATKNTPKNAEKFYCENCDFRCSKKSDYERHLNTRKHQLATKSTDFTPKNAEYFCDCGKKYKDRTGLWRHKKKCHLFHETTKNEYNSIIDEFTNIIAKQQETIEALVPKIGNTSITNNTNNTSNINDNRNFNINMFLNDQCKDAMNLTDFVDSIQLTLEDVMSIGEQGQTKGFANILIDKLSSMDMYKRPLHCSDVKRETLYIKNNDEWNKETEDRTQMKCAIDHISKKGLQTAPDLDIPEDKMCNTLLKWLRLLLTIKKLYPRLLKKLRFNSGIFKVILWTHKKVL